MSVFIYRYEEGGVVAGEALKTRLKKMRIRALLYSDGSQRALSAAIYAAAMMKNQPEMELTVINFMDSPSTTTGLIWDEGMATATVMADISKDILERTRKIFDEREIKVETVVGYGGDSIPEKIVQYAKEGDFNMIIMGTKGPSDLKAVVVGSLAHNVVHLSEIPVLLVKKIPDRLLNTLND